MTVEQWKQIPDEISRVASEWRKNAQAAEMPEDSCRVSVRSFAGSPRKTFGCTADSTQNRALG